MKNFDQKDVKYNSEEYSEGTFGHGSDESWEGD
jgi:hypothetical protein